MRRWLIPLTSILLTTTSVSVAAQSLEARLIGNAAIEISDGTTTLMTDFPYESGAFGYLPYPPETLTSRPGSICLITHSHADHFAPALVERVGCRVLAAPSVQSLVPAAQRLQWDGRRFEADGLRIEAIPTAHMEGHNSYRVEWHHRVFYFTGDTESTVELLEQRELDVLFITPWLADRMGDRWEEVARRLVIYHRAPGQSVASKPGWEIPDLGDVIDLTPGDSGQ